MAAGRNKVLLELAGQPLVLYSAATFRACADRLLLVAASDELDEMRRLLPDVPAITGGETRHGSERSALEALRGGLNPADVVAIHDAARPLVSPADVQAVFAAADEHGAAMLAVQAPAPALEVESGRVMRAYPAEQVWRAQTPQAARAGWLLDAYDRAARDGFDGTDTAAVLARAGYRVRVMAATSENPKLTVPEDLVVAERLLAERR
jgi:2-C-methyl-D-erythritol 4-phosphate cytidylyltransferase